MDNVDSIQGQMCNVRRDMEILRKNRKKWYRSKMLLREIKTTFSGLIRRLDTSEGRISHTGDMSIESSQLKSTRSETQSTKKVQSLKQKYQKKMSKGFEIPIKGIAYAL